MDSSYYHLPTNSSTEAYIKKYFELNPGLVPCEYRIGLRTIVA